MQPRNNASSSPYEKIILKSTMINTLQVHREIKGNPKYCTELPNILGIKLTNRCNLRCKHCYEWNKDGYHQNMSEQEQQQELPWDIFEKVLYETKEVNSNIYLWGGEPFCYSRIDDAIERIASEKRIVAICTNGQLVDKHIDVINKCGPWIEMLFAVDGLEEANDSLRGKGTFFNTIKNIKLLLEERADKRFLGKISIHCVISEYNYNTLFETVRFFESLGVDSVILCYPWYMSEKTSEEMDWFCRDKLSLALDLDKRHSWWAFKYKFSQEHYKELISERKKIMEYTWKMKVRFQPELSESEIQMFIDDKLECKQYMCQSIAERMEILPDGSISSCKHFPELVVGNLEYQGVKELWHSQKYNYFRETIQSDLMPVCTKCNNLYLHGGRKKKD